MDYPSWFSAVDTAGVLLGVGQVELQSGTWDASVTGIRIQGRISDRTSLRFSMLYPVIRRPGSFAHGFADGMISSVVRIYGDTLGVSGLFLRTDFRIPIGSVALRPFSFRSSGGGIYPDTGAGLEFRKETALFRVRGSATYTLVGQKETSGDLKNRDFSLLALLLDFDLRKGTSLQVSVFAMDFDGSGYRETYLFSFRHLLSQQMDLVVTGGLDLGSNSERVFDSLLSVCLTYHFHAGKDRVTVEENLQPVSTGLPH